MGVRDLLLAQLAADEHRVHSRIERARTQQCVGRDQVVEAVTPHGTQRVRGQWRLELEDSGGAAVTQHLIHLRVVEGKSRHVKPDTMPGVDHVHGIVNDCERFQPQQIHLEHADFFQRAHLVLGDDRIAFGVSTGALGWCRAHRHILRERTRRDDDTGRVYRHVPRYPLDPRAQLDQPLV